MFYKVVIKTTIISEQLNLTKFKVISWFNWSLSLEFTKLITVIPSYEKRSQILIIVEVPYLERNHNILG